MKVKPAHRNWRWQGGAVNPRPLLRPANPTRGALVATWIGNRLVVRPATTPN